MKSITLKTMVHVALLAAGSFNAPAQTPELEDLKSKMRLMEQTMQEMKQRIVELESQKTAPPAAVPPAADTTPPGDTTRVLFKPGPTEITGRASPIEDRGQLKSQQEAAQRPNDLTLDPQYRGYVPVPNTPVLIKFNAKPRVDLTVDDKNSGNSDRFVTATIPLKGSPEYGGDIQSDMNARGSQLS